ncbi:hypothetical protein FM106_04875 [Brachybacterium faecium]|nr:hypothetical protein FM106_04875 [Brachybacterium faecium]
MPLHYSVPSFTLLIFHHPKYTLLLLVTPYYFYRITIKN